MGAAAHELTIRVALGTGQTLRIGRSSANGVVLDLPGVSAVHAEVFLRAAPDGARRLCIRDTSKNGVGIRKRGAAIKRGRPEAWERVPNGEIMELGDDAELKLPLKSRIDDKQLPEAKRIMKLSLVPSAAPAPAAPALAEGDPKAIAAMIQGLAASAGTSVAEIIAQMEVDGSPAGAAKPRDCASLGQSPQQATSPGPAAWMDDDVDRPKAKRPKVVEQRLTASALASLGEEHGTAPPERDLSVSPISSPGVAKKKRKAESAGVKEKKKKKTKVEEKEAKKERSKAKKEPEAAPRQKEKKRK